jgi:hypothetical protein
MAVWTRYAYSSTLVLIIETQLHAKLNSFDKIFTVHFIMRYCRYCNKQNPLAKNSKVFFSSYIKEE